jgi:hypothetical protein
LHAQLEAGGAIGNLEHHEASDTLAARDLTQLDDADVERRA